MSFETLSSEKDHINSAEHLSLEATVIHHNFAQQILALNTPPLTIGESNPFLSALSAGNEPAAVAFRYRRWDMGNGIILIARTAVNGYNEKTIRRAVDDSDDVEDRLSGVTSSVEYSMSSTVDSATSTGGRSSSHRPAPYSQSK